MMNSNTGQNVGFYNGTGVHQSDTRFPVRQLREGRVVTAQETLTLLTFPDRPSLQGPNASLPWDGRLQL